MGSGNALGLRLRGSQLLPDLPVVYASGRVNMLDSKQRVPGSAFVAKPYAPEQVAQLLADTVRATAERVPA
jgi:hypothetical protein